MAVHAKRLSVLPNSTSTRKYTTIDSSGSDYCWPIQQRIICFRSVSNVKNKIFMNNNNAINTTLAQSLLPTTLYNESRLEKQHSVASAVEKH